MPLPDGDRQLVQIMDLALEDAAGRAGKWLACRPGCTQCCYGAFAINGLDAARLEAGMNALRVADPGRYEVIRERARGWIAEHGEDFPGDRDTGRLGSSEEELARFDQFANDAQCPALDPLTGLCGVYEWRPMACRVFGPPVRVGEGALACCELCFVGATEAEIEASEMRPPYELEARLVEETGEAAETIVAFALLRESS